MDNARSRDTRPDNQLPDIVRMRKRRDFLAAASKGNKVVASTLVLQGYPPRGAGGERSPAVPAASPTIAGQSAASSAAKEGQSTALPPIRVGFTVTKKTGNAVVRNRIRRRLRAAVDQLLAVNGRPGWDYVLIGRVRARDESFDIILRDLRYAIRKAAKLHEARP